MINRKLSLLLVIFPDKPNDNDPNDLSPVDTLHMIFIVKMPGGKVNAIFIVENRINRTQSIPRILNFEDVITHS